MSSLESVKKVVETYVESMKESSADKVKEKNFERIEHWPARFHAHTNYLCASRLSG